MMETGHVEAEGVHGCYTLRDEMIFVQALDRRKATQIGNTPVDTLADMLLREIIREANGRRAI